MSYYERLPVPRGPSWRSPNRVSAQDHSIAAQPSAYPLNDNYLLNNNPKKKQQYVNTIALVIFPILGLFKIFSKVIEVLYRLDLLLKIKIYLVYYIAILELVYRNYKLLVYK